MAVKSICDWCAEPTKCDYDVYEGWGGAPTLEWYDQNEESGSPYGPGMGKYHVASFCVDVWVTVPDGSGRNEISDDSCSVKFKRFRNIELVDRKYIVKKI